MSSMNHDRDGDPPSQYRMSNNSTSDQNQSANVLFQSSAGAIRNSEDMAAMDDAQFSASLDALLDSDNLVNSAAVQNATRPESTHDTTNTNSQFLVSTSAASAPPPGMSAAVAPQVVAPRVAPQVAAPAMAAAPPTMAVGNGHPSFAGTRSSLTARLGTFGSALPQMPPHFASSGAVPWAPASSVVPATVSTSANSSVVAGPTGSKNMKKSYSMSSAKRLRDVLTVSEDEEERERRRQDRNMREQQRSHRITEQISHLKEVLSAANIQFKPDKYSTLTKVVEYVKDLQERSALLDTEHQKLIETISKTNEIVNNQYVPAYASGSDPPVSSDFLTDGSSSPSSEESSFVRGINYKSVFAHSGVALALTSIDGRFLDCNKEFESLIGYQRAELLPVEQLADKAEDSKESGEGKQRRNLSLFNILSRDDMQIVFGAMSDMLRHNGEVVRSERSSGPKHVDYWSGQVRICRNVNEMFQLNVTLVRTMLGRPKFFDCAVTPLAEQETEEQQKAN